MAGNGTDATFEMIEDAKNVYTQIREAQKAA
jgi:hypothetical protein